MGCARHPCLRLLYYDLRMNVVTHQSLISTFLGMFMLPFSEKGGKLGDLGKSEGPASQNEGTKAQWRRKDKPKSQVEAV